MRIFACLTMMMAALASVAPATWLTGVKEASEMGPLEVLVPSIRRRLEPRKSFKPAEQNRIVGGDDAVLGQFPWQGSMQYGSMGHFCGLSILSKNFVVTAAHCVVAVDEDPSSISVKVGITNLNSKGQEVGVRAIYKHKDFDISKVINDIALLELAEPLELNQNVKPITIGVGRTPTSDINGCVISGWGATDPYGQYYPDDLQFLNVNFYDDAKCAEMWAESSWGNTYKNEVHLCAGTAKGDNACFGDSGGPIVCKTTEEGPGGNFYLFGATSFGGVPCGQSKLPAVFTELPYFIDWIEDKTGPLLRP